MRYIVLVFVVITFFGCTIVIPPKVEYRINSKIQGKSLSENGCKDKSLQIAQAFSSNALFSKDMSYRLGDSKQYVYASALWSISPNRAITAEFLSLIRDSKLFKNVQTSKSRSKNDIILELNIEDFMQYFNEESTLSYVHVIINVSMIDAKTNTVFASETFTKKIELKELNSRSGVEGLNMALEDILLQSNIWLAEVCK